MPEERLTLKRLTPCWTSQEANVFRKVWQLARAQRSTRCAALHPARSIALRIAFVERPRGVSSPPFL